VEGQKGGQKALTKEKDLFWEKKANGATHRQKKVEKKAVKKRYTPVLEVGTRSERYKKKKIKASVSIRSKTRGSSSPGA